MDTPEEQEKTNLIVVVSLIEDPLDAITSSLERELKETTKGYAVIEIDNHSDADLISTVLKGAARSKSRFLFNASKASNDLDGLMPILGYLARNKQIPVFVLGENALLKGHFLKFRLEVSEVNDPREALL